MMPVLTFDELNVLVFAGLVMGVIFGAVYHVFCLLRFLASGNGEMKKVRRVLFHVFQFFCDLAFFIIFTAGGIVLFSSYGKGQVRIIALVAVFLGFMLWHKIFGRLVYPFSVWLKRATAAVVSFIYRHTLRHVFVLLGGFVNKLGEKRMQMKIERYDKERKEELKKFVRREL